MTRFFLAALAAAFLLAGCGASTTSQPAPTRNVEVAETATAVESTDTIDEKEIPCRRDLGPGALRCPTCGQNLYLCEGKDTAYHPRKQNAPCPNTSWPELGTNGTRGLTGDE